MLLILYTTMGYVIHTFDMSPRGRPPRKSSTGSKDAPTALKEGKGSMGPPPDPVPPALILEPEADALSLSLKVTVDQVHASSPV